VQSTVTIRTSLAILFFSVQQMEREMKGLLKNWL